MANIPGATNVLPGVFTNVVTESAGGLVAPGLRVAAIIGEGITTETIVSGALGGGKDGLNSTYTSTSGADGRHFLLGIYPVVKNRATLYRNGVPLRGLETSKIDDSSFSNKYDYRIDVSNGRIELQKGYLQDLGGDVYLPFSTNKGDGYIAYLDGLIDGYGLLDANAPRETWSVRCISVQRDNSNNPIAGTAKFIASGSVSGNKVDANGNPVVWTSNGVPASNGILRFAIFQTVAGTNFQEGDGFTIKVNSGQLVKNDTLTASYIPEAYLNDPAFLQSLTDVIQRHGPVTVNDTLSLGAQLAFANSAPGIVTVQAAPPVPRRTSVILSESVPSKNEPVIADNFVFPLPLGVVPDPGPAPGDETPIYFFVKDNSNDVETQILPNKYPFYTVGTGSPEPTVQQFIEDNTQAPAGYSFSYTVIENYNNDATVLSGFDGYVARDPSVLSGDSGVFSSPSVTFTGDFKGKTLKIIDAKNSANNLDGYVYAVTNGKLYFNATFKPFGDEPLNPLDPPNINYQVIDPTNNTVVFSGTGATLSPTGLTATLSDGAAPFDASVVGKRIRINPPVDNEDADLGLFDVITFINGKDVELKKSVVIESDLRFEILDPDQTTSYVVVNKNVVPDGYALRVSLVDTKDASFYDAGWINALDSLEKAEVDIVVPLPLQNISGIFQNALSHCQTMSNIRNRKERVLFIGAIAGLKPDNLIGSAADGTNKPVAVENIGILEGIQGDNPTEVLNGNIEDLANYSVSDAFGGTYRCVYFYPDEIIVQAGAGNATVSGYFIAAAAAGYLSASPRIEMPLTNKVLSGFAILRSKLFTTLTLESLAASGVCTLQPVSGGGRVVWGITTTQSGFPEEQEISIVFIRDRIAKILRRSFAGYIGLPEAPDTAVTLTTQAVNILNSLISQGLITAYKDVGAQRDPVEPRQWNLVVKVQPVYPINWIYIKVGVGTI